MEKLQLRTDLASDLKKVGHRVVAGAMGGFLCGLVIGGVGGRLAMLLLRLTTGAEVIGLESDDGFTMGTLSSATVFLLGATAFMGAFVGIVYAFGRTWLPRRTRPLSTAVFLGLAGGAAVINPDGVDFTELRPLPLAIALFVLLPGLYGYAVSRVVDGLLARPVGKILPWLGVGTGLLVLVTQGLGGLGDVLIVLVVLLVLLAGAVAVRRFPNLRTLPAKPLVVGTVRLLLAAAGAFSAFVLAQDIEQIL